MGNAELNDRITAGLQEAEDFLRWRLSQGESFITDKISHLALAGGKRFRVVFALLAAQYGKNPTAR